MIINRVYLYSGRFSNSRFNTQNKVNLCLYVAFMISFGLANLVFVGLELIYDNQKSGSTSSKVQNLLGIQKEMSLILTVILTLLTLSIIAIGSFLVNRLRLFFKENYFKHSQTIIASIALTGIGVISMIGFNFIRSEHEDWL